MDDFQTTITIVFSYPISKNLQSQVIRKFHDIKDVQIIKISSANVKIKFYPQLYDQSYFEEQLKIMGILVDLCPFLH